MGRTSKRTSFVCVRSFFFGVSFLLCEEKNAFQEHSTPASPYSGSKTGTPYHLAGNVRNTQYPPLYIETVLVDQSFLYRKVHMPLPTNFRARTLARDGRVSQRTVVSLSFRQRSNPYPAKHFRPVSDSTSTRSSTAVSHASLTPPVTTNFRADSLSKPTGAGTPEKGWLWVDLVDIFPTL